MPDPRTEEMELEQIRRAREEKAAAEHADGETGEHAHARRAERAGYLAEKLRERGASEDERA